MLRALLPSLAALEELVVRRSERVTLDALNVVAECAPRTLQLLLMAGCFAVPDEATAQ
jgi:hypothetical protein